MINLTGKNIVITGASSGIGRQIAVEAAECGANIMLVARNEANLEATLQKCKPGNHHIFPFDVKDYRAIEPLIDEIHTKAGVISGFVHSAGIEITLPFRNMKPENYEELFGVNVISGFEFARIISRKKYIHTEGASYIFLGSVMGRYGKEGKVGYCASKAALSSSVKAMALELSSKKIRCNVILPGIVQTEMVTRMFETIPESSVNEIISRHPLGIGMPRDVADLAVFLLSDNARWITGSELVIDGGYSAQ